MAKDSLFGAREQPAKASVILKLRNPSRPLAPATVTGITNLVAASVEGLRPEAVVVMDSFGRPLAKPPADDDEPLGARAVGTAARARARLGDAGGDAARAGRRRRARPRQRRRAPVGGQRGADRRAVGSRNDGHPQPPDDDRRDARARRSARVAGARANLPAGRRAQRRAAGRRRRRRCWPRVGPIERDDQLRNQQDDAPHREAQRRCRAAVGGGDPRRRTGRQEGRRRARRRASSRSRKPEELQKIHGLVAAAVGSRPGAWRPADGREHRRSTRRRRKSRCRRR